MFCRNKNRFHYCINKKPEMSVKDIIKNFLLFIRKKKYNKAFRLLSLEKKATIRSLDKFIIYLQKNYKSIYHLDSWKLGKIIYNDDDLSCQCKVYIFNNNQTYIYDFKLSRQYDWIYNQPLYDPYSDEKLYLYWRIDSIHQIEIIESYVNQYAGNTDEDLNILDSKLELCSKNPLTGFYRDGYCRTGEDDTGTHTVCARVNDIFLKQQKEVGNDLITPNRNFPGLKDGDYWCLCANRYKQGLKNKIYLEVKQDATHIKSLEYLDKNQL